MKTHKVISRAISLLIQHFCWQYFTGDKFIFSHKGSKINGPLFQNYSEIIPFLIQEIVTIK